VFLFCRIIESEMAGKVGKGLLAGKPTAAESGSKQKEKKRPISQSSRVGLQVSTTSLFFQKVSCSELIYAIHAVYLLCYLYDFA
jgi:hypothetical protein